MTSNPGAERQPSSGSYSGQQNCGAERSEPLCAALPDSQSEREREIRSKVDWTETLTQADGEFLLSQLDETRRLNGEAFVILKGLDMAIDWELAPPIKKAIHEWVAEAERVLEGRGQ